MLLNALQSEISIHKEAKSKKLNDGVQVVVISISIII